jgi:CheY-like chemotaxis protein
MRTKLGCVLLVDDDDSDNYFHTKVLEKAGVAHHIETAMNGLEALDYLARSAKGGRADDHNPLPDLIFLDINMPVMDGWEFLEEFQKSAMPEMKKPVVIILTTSLNPADKTRAEKFMDGSNFQFKPMTPAMIDTIMHRHFPENL